MNGGEGGERSREIKRLMKSLWIILHDPYIVYERSRKTYFRGTLFEKIKYYVWGGTSSRGLENQTIITPTTIALIPGWLYYIAILYYIIGTYANTILYIFNFILTAAHDDTWYMHYI